MIIYAIKALSVMRFAFALSTLGRERAVSDKIKKPSHGELKTSKDADKLTGTCGTAKNIASWQEEVWEERKLQRITCYTQKRGSKNDHAKWQNDEASMRQNVRLIYALIINMEAFLTGEGPIEETFGQASVISIWEPAKRYVSCLYGSIVNHPILGKFVMPSEP